MAVAGLLRQFAAHGARDLGVSLFQALMSEQVEELKEAAERVRDCGQFPDDFCYGMEALAAWRAHYYAPALAMSPEQKAKIEHWDDEWTLGLVQQLRGL